jgi:hypothetical protein
MTHLATYALNFRLDSAARAFGFSGPVKGSASRRKYSGTLSGTLQVRGEVVDPDRLQGLVRTALSVSVTTPGGTLPGSCTPFDGTIVATRVTE